MSIITTTAQNVGTPGHDPFPMSTDTPTPRTESKLLSWSLTNSELRAAIGKQSLGFGGDNIQNRVVAADFARELERDLAAAKAEVAALQNKAISETYAVHMIEAANRRRAEEQEKNSTLQDLLFAQTQECRVFRAEIAALREDKARLDWLEKNRAAIRLDYVDWGIGSNFGTPLRTAIDAVRKGTT